MTSVKTQQDKQQN